MATKMNIAGLKTLDGSNYVVGEALADNDALVVTTIRYNRADAPYNKGFQIGGASYTVSFRDNEELRILVPQTAVLHVAILREKKEEPEAVGLGE